VPASPITYSKGVDAAAAVVKRSSAGRKGDRDPGDAADAEQSGTPRTRPVTTLGRLERAGEPTPGTGIPKPFEEVTLEEMDRVFDIQRPRRLRRDAGGLKQ